MSKKYFILLIIAVCILWPISKTGAYIFDSLFKDYSLVAMVLFISLFKFCWDRIDGPCSERVLAALKKYESEHPSKILDEGNVGQETFVDASKIARNIITLFKQRQEIISTSGAGESMLKDDHSSENFISVITITRQGVVNVTLCCDDESAGYAEIVKGHLKDSFGISRRDTKIKNVLG